MRIVLYFLSLLLVVSVAEARASSTIETTLVCYLDQFSEPNVLSSIGLNHSFYVKNQLNAQGTFLKKISFFDYLSNFQKNQDFLTNKKIHFRHFTDLAYRISKNHLIWFCVFRI